MKPPSVITKHFAGSTGMGVATSRQRGMALVMAMVILMILTILGITAMTTSSLEEKMSGNIQEQTRAFQAAESGVSEAIARIIAGTSGGVIPTFTINYQGGRSSARVMSTSNGTVSGGNRCSGSNSSTCQGAETSAWFYYQIASRGTTTTNARTLVEQGVKISGPGNISGN